jgi:molybdopterin-guanine dinucleotide biosynthesis protein B
METKQAILAISGIKKSGKTTLIEKLIPRLAERGLRVAVVKHDAHSFTPDTPGTDSFRFFSAGACGTLIFDSEKYSLTRRVPVTREWVTGQFPDADLVLCEGLSRSAYPKIEIIPLDSDEAPICDPASCVAYICRGDFATDKPVFHPDDLEAITDFVASFAQGGCRDA